MVTELTVPVLRAWIRDLVGRLSPSSINNSAIALTRFLSDARAEQWVALDANPMKHEDVRAMLPTVQEPDPEEIIQWTRDEVEKLLAVPTLPDDRFGLYLVVIVAGLRAGEARGLTFARVMLDAPIPLLRIVQQEKLKREAGDEGGTETPKTRSSKRDVPLHPFAITWLRWWRDAGWSKVYGRQRTDSDAVFPARNGKAGRPRDADILRRDLTAAELPLDFVTPDGKLLPYTFHATRRTFSRLLGDNGVSPEMVGMLDGHAAKTVTERRYMGRSLEAMARAVATLDLALPERSGVPPKDAQDTALSSKNSPNPLVTKTTGRPKYMNSYTQANEMARLATSSRLAVTRARRCRRRNCSRPRSRSPRARRFRSRRLPRASARWAI
jgi:integrase